MAGTNPDREAKVIGATVGGAAGGLIGALLGGPLGALLGAAASSWLGHEVAVEVKKHGF